MESVPIHTGIIEHSSLFGALKLDRSLHLLLNQSNWVLKILSLNSSTYCVGCILYGLYCMAYTSIVDHIESIV